MGDCALLAFLDLSAAFDTVDKRILLERLSRSFGIEDIALKWFQFYLTNRTNTFYSTGTSPRYALFSSAFHMDQCLDRYYSYFTLYTSDLEKIAENHNLDAHFYAFYFYFPSQLYIFSKPQFADSAQLALLPVWTSSRSG